LHFVLYIQEKQDNKNQKDQLLYSLVYYKIETCLKCIAELFNEAVTYDRWDRTRKAINNLSLRKTIMI